MSVPEDELASLIDRFHRAYPGRIEVLPDGAEVSITSNGTAVTHRLVRASAVSFRWDNGAIRHGTLRLGLMFDGQPSVIVAVERDRQLKDYRVTVDQITSFDEPTS